MESAIGAAKLVLSLVLFLAFLLIVFYVFIPNVFLRLCLRAVTYVTRFNRKSLRVGNFVFHYIERRGSPSNSTTLLLLHGFTDTKDSWAIMSLYLPKAWRIIALDLPGHGETTREEHEEHNVHFLVSRLEQFVQGMLLDKCGFHMVGCSLGGKMAGVYSSYHPGQVKSLALLCPFGVEMPQQSALARSYFESGCRRKSNCFLPETPAEMRDLLKLALHKVPSLPNHFLNRLVRHRRPSYSFFDKMTDHLLDPSYRYLLQQQMRFIKCPTLVIWGRQDEVLDVSCVDVLREGIPHCKSVILEECAHAIYLDKPNCTALLITDFIQKLSLNSF